MIRQVGYVVAGRIEINLFIIVSVGILYQVINAAHGNHSTEEIRSFQKQVHGVKGAKRCATGSDGRFIRSEGPDERNHFVENIFIELLVADGLVRSFHLLVHPADHDTESRPHDDWSVDRLPSAGVPADRYPLLVKQVLGWTFQRSGLYVALRARSLSERPCG